MRAYHAEKSETKRDEIEARQARLLNEHLPRGARRIRTFEVAEALKLMHDARETDNALPVIGADNQNGWMISARQSTSLWRIYLTLRRGNTVLARLMIECCKRKPLTKSRSEN
jgi:hypothetical protein